MRHRLFACAAMLLIVLVLALPASFGWGGNAERTIADKAVDTLPDEMLPFFQASRQFISRHVTDPIELEAKNPVDRHNGFIQLDHYGQFPFSDLPRVYTAAVEKYGRRTVEARGVLPWQIGLYSQKLTDAFRARDWDDVRLSAAFLAHYVAEAHDPFKATMNSDGALSNQVGVNDRFGRGLVDRYARFFYLTSTEATLINDPTDHAFETSLSAHAALESILLADRRSHQGFTIYNDEYYDRFYAQAGSVLIRQISDAATDVGSYWMTAWINASRPQLPAN